MNVSDAETLERLESIRLATQQSSTGEALPRAIGTADVQFLLALLNERDHVIGALRDDITAARRANRDATDLGSVGTVEQILREALLRVPTTPPTLHFVADSSTTVAIKPSSAHGFRTLTLENATGTLKVRLARPVLQEIVVGAGSL